MSGHSKWHSIKHKKAAVDAKRGKAFTKVIREITTAAKSGGGDPDANPRLRTAVAAAKSLNMPADNIKKAIQKGTGELPGVSYDETTYEGYGPGGVAVYVEVMTDNKNRTVGEIRHLFVKNNGNLGENGCVAWMFDKKGYVVVEKEKTTEEDLMNAALEAGAEDIQEDGANWEVFTAPEELEAVREGLEKAGVEFVTAEVSMIPQNRVKLTGKEVTQMLRLMDALEDHDDVQNVHANFDIDDEELEKFAG